MGNLISLLIFFGFWLFVIAIALAAYMAVKYNALQKQAQQIKEGASNVQVMLKKRFELSNRLLDIATGYADHEKLIVLKVSQDRNDVLSQRTTQNFQQSNEAIRYVTQLAENYPQLKADHTYLRLMHDLKIVEDELQGKREWYNRFVRDYNSNINSVPTVFFAGKIGFETAPYINFDDPEGLDNIKEFRTADATRLNALVKDFGSQALAVSQTLGSAVSQASAELMERGKRTKRYFYMDVNNQRQGAVTLQELERLRMNNELRDESWVIEETGKEWIPYQNIRPRSASNLPEPPPPAPPSWKDGTQ